MDETPILPFGDLWRVYSDWLNATEFGTHITHFQLLNTEWDAALFAREMHFGLSGRLSQLASNDAFYYSTFVVRLFPAPHVSSAYAWPQRGRYDSPIKDNRTSMVVSQYAAGHGPKYRARKWLANIPSSEISGRHVSTDYQRDVAIAFGEMESIYNPSNLTRNAMWGILHRYVNHSLLVPHPFYFVPIVRTMPRLKLSSRATRKPTLLFGDEPTQSRWSALLAQWEAEQ